MAIVPYNPWYDASYEVIPHMANWEVLDADVPKKVVCVFAWMRQTIMAIKDRGGLSKWARYSPADVQTAMSRAASQFSPLHRLDLRSCDMAEIEPRLLSVLEIVVPPFGTVAASKYLHFSAPKLIPMWDLAIRKARGHKDCPQGFIRYMRAFKSELEIPSNLQAALLAYSSNPVRGWDILNMRNRDA